MKDKLESIIDRYNTIEKLMADQEVLSNPEKLKEIAKEYIKVLDQIVDSELIIEENEPDLKELAVEDLALNKQRKIKLENELKIKLLHPH